MSQLSEDLLLEEAPDEFSRLEEEGQFEDPLTMGIRQREKVQLSSHVQLIDSLKKENFGLKLRIYYLTENLEKLTPEGIKDIVRDVLFSVHACLARRVEGSSARLGQLCS